ncbi:FHA domain-containing protein [Phototrophicus methaneseepsis]|uniref:FHA domain-containing protein n=1 Tax=Phototrophicus methaneseepsis TaxID=2710758 RepID=A0A7S8ECP7_9CHLR|nr:FHA domain-containing protein [Phototrophicus methaneseepsis]QPC84531.1 FHA domain-containing protein [Phototrophicus methaneseepsis]
MAHTPSLETAVDVFKENGAVYPAGQTQYLNMDTTHEQMPPRSPEQVHSVAPATIQFTVEGTSDTVMMPLRNHMVLGRKQSPNDRQVDVDLSHLGARKMGVSRHHAIIQVTRDQVAIKDFNSTNGTFINGYILKPMFGYSLRHGDVIQLGLLKLLVHFPTED